MKQASAEAKSGVSVSKSEQVRKAWTPERRKAQSELFKRIRPWENAKGPKTPEGKARSGKNAWKGGMRPKIRDANQLLRKLRNRIKELTK